MSSPPHKPLLSLQPTTAYLEPFGGIKPSQGGGGGDSPMAWDQVPSPIPHSASLEEYRFGTVAPSPTDDDGELASDDGPSSRESSAAGSADDDACWPPPTVSLSPTTVQQQQEASFVRSSMPPPPLPPPASSSSVSSTTSPVAPASAAGRRKGLLRMPRSAQTGPVPPSLLARRGSLGSSAFSRSNSLDVVGRSLTFDHPALFEPPFEMTEGTTTTTTTTLLAHRTASSLLPSPNVPSRLGSPIGRPVLSQRRDKPSSWSTAASPGGSAGLSTSAPSSSYFPVVQPPSMLGNGGAPMTPDASPTVVLSRPSPLKSVGSRTSELAISSASVYGSQARSGAFPFPLQATSGTATPPTTPAYATARPLLKLPSKALKKSLSPPATLHGGQLSPHLLDDHVLNPLFNSRFELCSTLGSGGFGFVCIALDRRELCEVAVKFILKAKVPAHSWVAFGPHGTEGDGMPPVGGKVPMECELLLRVKHSGIVAGLACFADDKFFYLVQELHGSSWGPSTPGTPMSGNTPSVSAYVPALIEGVPLPSPYAPSFALPPSPSFGPPPSSFGPPTPQRPSMTFERRGSCDLFECVEAHKRFSENRSRMIFTQIVETVHYLAGHRIFHRDIKDENIVVDRDYRVKLIDFGSAVWEHGDKPVIYREFYGTTAYAAAEILAGGSYEASQAEVWSLGILLNILLTGESPFASPADAQRSRRSPLRPGVSMSAEAADLITRCLDVNPASRLTIDGIRGHRWLGLSTLSTRR